VDKSSLEMLIRRLEILSAIFGVVAVVGAGGSSFFGIRLLWNNWKLERIQAGENAQLFSDAEVAKKDRAIAQLELARIERRFAPRKLNAEEAKRIEEKLTGHKARIAIVEARPDDSEAKDFIADMENVFRRADWKYTVTADPNRISRKLGGLLVVINKDASDADPTIEKDAESLVTALSDEKIFAQGPVTTQSGVKEIFDGTGDAPIVLIVGAKPDFEGKQN
jgi:hypothetical protein